MQVFHIIVLMLVLKKDTEKKLYIFSLFLITYKSPICLFMPYFMFIQSVFHIFPFFVPESSTSIMSYIIQNISIHLAQILQPLQFSTLFFELTILNNLCKTIVHAALTHSEVDCHLLKFQYSV